MSRPLHTIGVITAVVTTAGLITGVSGVELATAGSVTATAGVNIRSGPGTGYRILGTLYRGQSLTKLAAASNGWIKVRFHGHTAYVSGKYLSTGTTALPSAPTTIYTSGTKITTAALNVRSSASLAASIVGYVSKGHRVTLTGKASRGFAEILYGGSREWVSAQYLTNAGGDLPKITGSRTATDDLILRSTSGSDFRSLGEVKKGTKLSVTGTIQNGRAQIVYRQAVRWVTARYLTNSAVSLPAAPGLPRVVATRYATTALNIRSNPSSRYTLIGEVPRGTKLAITGARSSGRAQIIYRGAVRWVTAQYLSATRASGSSGSSSGSTGSGGTGSSSVSYAVERGLKPNAIKVHRATLAAFPAIRTYYGVHADPIPDHPSGHALDLMLPFSNYKSAAGQAYGHRVANWARANARTLGIQYVIFDQHIWNIQRDSEGWRYMADRGDDSANHKNHVHITVY